MRARSAATPILIVVAVGIVPTTSSQDMTASSLEVLDVVLEPIGEGKNVARVQVRNPTADELVLAVDLGSKSPDFGNLGWGDTFYEAVPGGATKSVRLLCRIHGPVTERTRLWMRFHTLRARDEYDYDSPDEVRRFDAAQLTRRRADDGEQIALSTETGRAIIAAFERLQRSLRAERYRDAWAMLTPDHQWLAYREQAGFLDSMRSEGIWFAFTWSRDEFLEVHPTTLRRRPDDVWTLTARRGEETWFIDVVPRDGTWLVDWITGVPLALRWQDWKQRLPSEMQRHQTKHM
ncbi:MAG: hypothetical protein ACYSTY_02805, partial [Planctomycetota bacterium]